MPDVKTMTKTPLRSTVWGAWVDAFWRHIHRQAVWFPFLHEMYNRQMAPVGLLRTARNVARRLRSSQVPDEAPAPQLAVDPRCDVLFVALGDRANCLGVGKRLARIIDERDVPIRMAFFQPEEEIILDTEASRRYRVVTMRRRMRFSLLWRFPWMALRAYVIGVSNPIVRSFVLRHPVVTLFVLLKSMIRCDSCEVVLRETGARMVVAANEGGVSSGGAALFAVARRTGIRTVQYLHGMPNRMFVPFLADEFWMWSDLTIEMLRRQSADEASIHRMLPIGSLEYDECYYPDAADRVTPVASSARHVLIISQLGCDPAWGTEVFGMLARRLAMALRDVEDLSVRVRLHPNELEQEIVRWQTILDGIPFEVSPRTRSLSDDVSWATHVYGNGSTAILAALKSGKPAYLVWDGALDEIHGSAPFPAEYVLTTEDQIRDSLRREWAEGESEAVLRSVIYPEGALDRAVDRMALLVRQSKGNGVTR